MDEDGAAPSDEPGLSSEDRALRYFIAIILDSVADFERFRSLGYVQFATKLNNIRLYQQMLPPFSEEAMADLWKIFAQWYFDHWSPAPKSARQKTQKGLKKTLEKPLDNAKAGEYWAGLKRDGFATKQGFGNIDMKGVEAYLESQALKHPGKFVTGFPICTKTPKTRMPKVKSPEDIMQEVERAMKEVNLDEKKPKVRKAPKDITRGIERAMRKINLDGIKPGRVRAPKDIKGKPRRKRAPKDIKREMGECPGAPRHYSSLTRKPRITKNVRKKANDHALDNAKNLLGLSIGKKLDVEHWSVTGKWGQLDWDEAFADQVHSQKGRGGKESLDSASTGKATAG